MAKVNLSKNVSEKSLKEFLEEDFDDMIKYADWRRGEQLKVLIEKELKKKSKKA